jgi:glycerate kinase
MGGAMVVLGGQLRSGYRLVADLVDLAAALEGADRVITGEGALDAGSFSGKVVGGVVGDACGQGIPTLVVVGRSTAEAEAEASAEGGEVVSLVERFGAARAFGEVLACVEEVTSGWLGAPTG